MRAFLRWHCRLISELLYQNEIGYTDIPIRYLIVRMRETAQQSRGDTRSDEIHDKITEISTQLAALSRKRFREDRQKKRYTSNLVRSETVCFSLKRIVRRKLNASLLVRISVKLGLNSEILVNTFEFPYLCNFQELA